MQVYAIIFKVINNAVGHIKRGFKMKKLILAVFVSLFVATPMATTLSATVSADDGADHESSETTSEAEEKTKEVSATYNYVAQPGDNYSVLARKAVQTYGLMTGTNLSGAQIIFAETNLTLESGSPELNHGEAVEITQADVQMWVEKAKALSEADEANWNYYVQFVDFNTDKNGQA